MTLQKRITYLLLILLIGPLAACASQGPGLPVTGQTPPVEMPSNTPGLPPKAVLDAQQWLATHLSAAAERVKIVEVEHAEWTDSCLGLGRLNESCAQVITPGWRVVFELDGQRYEFRTDETAATIRLSTPNAEVTLENTLWSLVSFGPPGADTPLVEGSTVTLMLADGQAGGLGGCNSYGGMYEVEGRDIFFDRITSTLRACANERVTEQEQRYFQALESARSYELEGNLLRIKYDNGTGMLVFETPLPARHAPATVTPGS